MKKRVNPLSKFKLVYRPGKTPTKIALLAVIVLSTAALLAIHIAIASGQEQVNSLKTSVADLWNQQHALQQKINMLGTKESVFDIAKEQLGLVDPDTVIFTPGN